MIHLDNINFGYRKGKELFHALDLHIEEGHLYGLLGKNGAGKTTLLKIICGLRFPQSGNSTVLGYNPIHRHPDMMSRIYFLQEEFFAPHLSIGDYAKIYAPFYPHFNKEQYLYYLNEFEMTRLDEYIDKLSYGQKKKVMISFALAANTPLLLMDEPTNGLDIPSKSIFRKVMASSIQEERIVIISTHQVRDLHSLIDSIVILDNGEIILNSSTDQITEHLLFEVKDEIIDKKTILYSEETLRGIYSVSENPARKESKLDMELLFNAVMANKQRMKEIFKSNKTL